MATKENVHTSHDGFYVLVPRDQEHLILVLLRKTRPLSPKERLAGRQAEIAGRPPNIEIPEKYARLMCPACSAIDPHDAFDVGFDRDITIRISGDFAPSDDGIFLISKRMLTVLRRDNVQGFETKPVGQGDWFAVRITRVVESDPKVWKSRGRKCPKCGRPEEVIGGFQRTSEITVPKATNTLFTPQRVHLRGRSWFRTDARTVMLTGDVVTILVRNGIKGGACRKLLTDEEWRLWQSASRAAKSYIDSPGVVKL